MRQSRSSRPWHWARIKAAAFLALASGLPVACQGPHPTGWSTPKPQVSPFDPTQSAEARTEALLAEMTLEEKIGQMCQYVGEAATQPGGNVDEMVGYRHAIEERAELVRLGRVGSFLKVPGFREANYLQELAATSRLRIPLLIATDAIHGHGMDTEEATIFPTPIGLASAFDPALVERIARATAQEMRVTGFHWTFSPNLDVTRDPRWGRTGETFGEDPFLVSELGVAMVRGYQGQEIAEKDNVLACTKHLVAGGISDNGLNGAPAEVSERTLREVFYPPFVRAVQAGVYTAMPAHNEVNGIPCHADRAMLTGLLRQDWGFRGFVVSDWNDIPRLHTVHRVAETRKDADRIAVMAGIDMHMHGNEFFENVLSLVREGRIPKPRIDDAARRILLAKFRLGLFENRKAEEKEIKATVLSPAHRALALEASRKSMVLLKNEHDLLPLTPGGTLFVTGPNANDQSILGDWTRLQPEENLITVVEGLRQLAPPGTRIDHFPSGAIDHLTDQDIKEAARRARAARVAVVVVGENSIRQNPDRTSGENIDRASLELAGRQLELVEAIRATGTPTVVVLVNGAPIASERLVEQANALLEAWEPGLVGGTAVAEVLLGHYNPSGKLPITIPRSVGHLRNHYDHRPSAQHRGKFKGSSSEPLFPFGYGLSYTQFTYGQVRAKARIGLQEAQQVEIDVENSGTRAGEDIVLLYIQDLYASVSRPGKELKAFRRIFLGPGERRTLSFSLPPETFALLDRKLRKTVEPGEFRLTIGANDASFTFRVEEKRN